MLQKHHLLVDGLRVVEEVELGDLVRHALSCLTVSVNRGLLLRALDVVEVEQVRVKDDLRAVVEEHAVRAVGKHVAQTVLRGEVYELGHELGAGLSLTLLDEKGWVHRESACRLDFG